MPSKYPLNNAKSKKNTRETVYGITSLSRLKMPPHNDSSLSTVAIGPLKTASTMPATSLSMKTVPLSVPKMPQRLWLLSEILLSVFSVGYHVPLLRKPSELWPMRLVLLSGSFVSDTRLLFLLCLISEIPPGPREFPSPNPPFLCHFSAFASILPALSPFVLPAGHLTPTMPLVSWTLTLPCLIPICPLFL